MIKEIISGRNEDYSFFIQCLCGNEILQFYYFKPTNIDEEIIGLKFYGIVKRAKDSKCTNFFFDRKSFDYFVKAIHKMIISEGPVHGVIADNQDFLIYDKDKYGFYTLLKSRSKILLSKKQYVWDITLRKSEMEEIYNRLLKIKEVIESVKGSESQRTEGII